MAVRLKNPFEVHALLTAQTQAIMGAQSPAIDKTGAVPAQNRLATAILILQNTKIPCSITPVLSGVAIVPGGRSASTFIQDCIFLATDVPMDPNPKNAGKRLNLRQGIGCTLMIGPGPSPPQVAQLQMQLWEGGLMAGGYLYRFSLADRNFQA